MDIDISEFSPEKIKWNLSKIDKNLKHDGRNIKNEVYHEKIMRVLLFLFLLRKSSDPLEELFKTRKKFNHPPSLTQIDGNKFKIWIQLGKENELGNPQKYKIGIGLKLISI